MNSVIAVSEYTLTKPKGGSIKFKLQTTNFKAGKFRDFTKRKPLVPQPSGWTYVYVCECGEATPPFTGERDRSQIPADVLEAMHEHVQTRHR